MQYLLHIDTSTDEGAVAIGCDGKLVALRTNTESRNHAGTINNIIHDVLADIKITVNDIAAFVVCAGPGSYTGLRIGMATAKGLCYALDKPLVLTNKLTLLAYQSYHDHKKSASQYVTVLQAREKEYFISAYNNDFSCTLCPQHITEEQLKSSIENKENTCFITNLPGIISEVGFVNQQIDTSININFELWAFYAFSQFKCNEIVILSSAEPFYLKQVYTHK